MTKKNCPAPPEMAADWSLYFLWCQGDRIYTGISPDPRRRYQVHQRGKGARFTRMYPPLAMKVIACHLTRNEALSLEHRYRTMTHAQKHALWENSVLQIMFV